MDVVFIQCIWYYTYSGCDVLYTKGVISLKVWVWWHTFSAVMSYTMDIMSSYIADEISKINLVWYHQYSGCDDTYSGYNVKYSGCDVIKMVVWCHKVRMWSLVQCKRCHTLTESDVIHSVCDVLNRLRVMTQISGSDVTCIVYMWPYILDVVSYIEAVMA